MLWTCSGFHPIFIYIPIKVHVFFTPWKPCVMFPLNFLVLLPQLSLLCRCHLWYLLPLLLQLSFLWNCHLWYFCIRFGCLYNYWHYPYHYWHCRWFHFALHHFLCPYIYAIMFLFTFELEAPPSSTLFFLLKTLFKESIVAFFLFSSIVCISSLVLLTLAGDLSRFSF